MTDHYSILGIHKGASASEIKTAYKKQAMKWHPDRNKGNEKRAAEEFVAIKRAHDVLLGLEKGSESHRSSSRSKPTGKPFDPFDKAGSPPREHDQSSSQRGRRNTNANNYKGFADDEPKRRGRAKTTYSEYPDASEGRYDTYGGRSRSNTQHDHFRKHEKPLNTHRQKKPSHYHEPSYEYREPRESLHHRDRTHRTPSQEPSYEYREPRASSHHRDRTHRTPTYHESNTYEYPDPRAGPRYEYREPRDSFHCEYRDPRETSYSRKRSPTSSSYYESDSRYEEPSYHRRQDPRNYDWNEPSEQSQYDYSYNSRRTSPSVHDYSSDGDSSSYSRRQYETPSRSPPHYRTRQESTSPRRYEYEEPSSFDFRDLHESLYESAGDFHREAMRDHARAMRGAGCRAPRENVKSFLRMFVT